MENRYPLLAGRRILRKESLWDIRDYAYGGWQLYYMDYTDGLLKGCAIKAQSGVLTIGKGMLKFHGFIYLMQEDEKVPYSPADGWQSLKAEFTEDESSLDDKVYQGRFFLDNETGLKENQMEMCRFYLREGSVLRDSYKDFADMATEYDMLYLCNAAVAGIGEGRFHPGILKQFAKELWVQKGKEGADIALCYEIWNRDGEIQMALLRAWLEGKGISWGTDRMAKEEVFCCMEEVLRKGNVGGSRKRSEKVIYVE